MEVEKYTNFEDYVSRLKRFTDDDRSVDEKFLRALRLSRQKDKKTLDSWFDGSFAKKFNIEDEEKELFSSFASDYLSSGIYDGNFEMLLYGNSNLFSKMVSDFGQNELWKIRSGVDESRSQPFISEELGMYMQIEKKGKPFIEYIGSPKKNILFDGNFRTASIIFPGVHCNMFNPVRGDLTLLASSPGIFLY